ncbi:MAG: hypothetical protein M1600_06420 [Firmicutes bacterium]|nr:hypothetical protein [Bacillota bacterium]
MTALTSAFMRNKFFGITAIGQRGAMAPTAKAKHALKRVDRFRGNAGVDIKVACRDLIETVIKNARQIC